MRRGRAGCRMVAYAAAGALALSGCVPRAGAPTGMPAADPAALATSLAQATLPTRSQQINFNWTLNEQGSRVSGKGVVRATPDRVRLDLFGARNERYLSAALVGEEFRFPGGGAPQGVPLPSPALLWGALGVVRPPASAELLDATTADSASVLRYRTADGDIFQYRVYTSAPTPRLAQLERVSGSSVIESVRLDRSPTGELIRARYRDWNAYRDLTLEVENSKDVASFPEETWNP